MDKPLPKKIPYTDLLFIGVLTILTIFIHGYSFDLGDQFLYIPLLHKLINPSLFPQDYIFPLLFSHRTIAYDLILLFKQIFQFNEVNILFALYVLSTYCWYGGLYHLTLALFHDRKAALLVGLLFVWPFPVAGAAITTVETGFELRLITNVLLLCTLIAFLRDRRRIGAVCLSLILLVHPLSGVIFSLLLIPLSVIIRKQKRINFLLESAGIIGSITFWIFVYYARRFPQTLPFITGGQWLNILKLRNSYAFPLQWSVLSWIYFVFSLTPLLAFVFLQKDSSTEKSNFAFIMWVFLVSAFLLAFQILFTSIYPITYIIIMQLGRVWLVPIVFSFICLAKFLSKLLAEFSESYLKIAMALVLIGIILVRHNRPILTQESSWIETQMWVKEHTNSLCTVLVNFNSQGFRVYSDRSVVGEYKDGTLSFYSPTFAYEWNRRKNDIVNTNYANIQNLNHLQQTYPFSLIVSYQEQKVPLKPILQNEKYAVYQMPQVQPECIIRV